MGDGFGPLIARPSFFVLMLSGRQMTLRGVEIILKRAAANIDSEMEKNRHRVLPPTLPDPESAPTPWYALRFGSIAIG
jgi:hypothetical protein